MVTHYEIGFHELMGGRKLWIVWACRFDGSCSVVFTSRDEESAHARGEALALMLRCRRDFEPVSPDSPVTDRATAILKGGAR